MKNNYKEYKQLNLTETADEIRRYWEENDTFQKSLDNRDKDNAFVFFEGPPSANGTPGIHHVMARSIKDVVCRYQTLKGKHVVRKAGWDTHGLPVELGVEKKLGITKEDIGKKISVDDYNRACREEVMKYQPIVWSADHTPWFRWNQRAQSQMRYSTQYTCPQTGSVKRAFT